MLSPLGISARLTPAEGLQPYLWPRCRRDSLFIGTLTTTFGGNEESCKEDARCSDSD